jgi:hypothetical protein
MKKDSGVSQQRETENSVNSGLTSLKVKMKENYFWIGVIL